MITINECFNEIDNLLIIFKNQKDCSKSEAKLLDNVIKSI